MGLPGERTWARLNSALFARLGPDRYALWIRHARLVRFDETEMVVHFPSGRIRDRAATLCLHVVSDALDRLLQGPLKVVFAADPERVARDGAILRDAPAMVPGPQTFDTFVVGPGVLHAHRAARHLVEHEPPAFATLLIQGEPGSGKTHLLRAVARALASRKRGSVLFLTGEDFHRQLAGAQARGNLDGFRKRIRAADALLLDDFEQLSGKFESQREFTQSFLALAERRKRVAIACGRPPRLLRGMSRYLQTRLRADVEVMLERPDGETALRILRARAPAGTPDEVLEVLAAHIQSGPGDLLLALERLVAGGTMTVPAARAAAAEFLNQWSSGLTFEDISRAAAQNFRVSFSDIYSEKRTRPVAGARQACYWLARKLLGSPFASIGSHYGGRDHSTVLLACQRISRARDAELRTKLKRMEEELAALDR